MRNPLALIRQLERVDDIHIEQAVAVVVEQGHATASGLEDVVLRTTAAERPGGDAGHFFELHRRGDGGSRAASCTGNGRENPVFQPEAEDGDAGVLAEPQRTEPQRP